MGRNADETTWNPLVQLSRNYKSSTSIFYFFTGNNINGWETIWKSPRHHNFQNRDIIWLDSWMRNVLFEHFHIGFRKFNFYKSFSLQFERFLIISPSFSISIWKNLHSQQKTIEFLWTKSRLRSVPEFPKSTITSMEQKWELQCSQHAIWCVLDRNCPLRSSKFPKISDRIYF